MSDHPRNRAELARDVLGPDEQAAYAAARLTHPRRRRVAGTPRVLPEWDADRAAAAAEGDGRWDG